MTPQKKAKSLVDSYKKYAHATPDDEFFSEILLDNAKKCSILCIDEIMQITPSVYVTKDEEIHNGHYQYWLEVKNEIIKLNN